MRLLGVLAAAAALAFLFRDAGGAPAPAGTPSIEAKDLAGNPWRLADERGSIVLVNYWATWCPPCRAEMPGLARVAAAYRDKGVKIVGISMDDEAGAVREFLAQHPVPYTILRPGADDALGAGVEALPTSYLIDRTGRVAKAYTGLLREPDLERDLAWLLRGEPPASQMHP